MLSIADVSAAYGRIEVVHGVSLEVPEGSVYALLGPNGAGKSTLLKVASGRMPATTGTVTFDGEEIRRPLPDRLARRGLCAVPEGRAVFPNLTVAENLLMYSYRSRATKVADLEEQSYARFPVLGRAASAAGGTALGGRAADAGPGPGAVHEPTHVAPRRDLDGPRPARRGRALRARGAGRGAGGHHHPPRGTVRPDGAWPSPTKPE